MGMVRGHLRRKPRPVVQQAETVQRFEDAKDAKIVVVVPSQPEALPRRLTTREKIKKTLEVPAHLKRKKRPKKRDDLQEFSEDADDLARTLERLK